MVGSKRSTDNIPYSLDCFADLLYKTSFSYAIIFRPAQRYFLFKKNKTTPFMRQATVICNVYIWNQTKINPFRFR